MKKVLLGGVALITLGFVGSASAADMPIKAPPVVVSNTWTGWYIGGNIGGGDYKNSQSFSQTADPALNPFGIVFDPVTFNGQGTWGATGGIHAGYNWQLTPSWLIGFEGDWDKADVGNTDGQQFLTNGGLPIAPCFGGPPAAANCHGLTMSQNLNWTASARARLGWIWGSTMFYGTAGAAWANEELSGQVAAAPFNTGSIAVSGNHSESGWVAGGGVEFMATANWLLRLEYLHYQFSGGTTNTAACGLCVFGAFAGPGHFTYGSSTWDVLRAGLTYKF
jgi:outer membrane immunogenic protein